jgi:hypothetical protein
MQHEPDNLAALKAACSDMIEISTTIVCPKFPVIRADLNIFPR